MVSGLLWQFPVHVNAVKKDIDGFGVDVPWLLKGSIIFVHIMDSGRVLFAQPVNNIDFSLIPKDMALILRLGR